MHATVISNFFRCENIFVLRTASENNLREYIYTRINMNKVKHEIRSVRNYFNVEKIYAKIA